MIGRRYKLHKDNVIDLFEKYKKTRDNLNNGVDIRFLESKVESLKNGKFILAVAGEVKAGKSTFINALLDTELLPSDVLQASSAIVEIFKSDKSYLKVKFADGKEEIVYDDLDTCDVNEAQERLQEICKIHDEDREIPTTLLDSYIIETDGKIGVTDDFIKQLEQRSGEHLQDKQKVIERYILKRTKDTIPVKIEFGYNLKWEFDELRIVDSPGVNATGGVQDVSFRFFEEANAILFVHPIKPIESESFKKFVKNTISTRSKEMLFLILTHAGMYANDEVERLHKEANRLYKDIIPVDRILVVDSLLKLIHCDLNNGRSISDIRKSENKRKILSDYRDQAEENGRELIDVVYEASRFNKMFDIIDEFTMKAPNLQLQEILEKIKAGYEEQEKLYTEKVERLEKKKINPQKFEEEINRIQDALENYKLLTKQTKEDLTSKYSGRHSSWQKDIDAMKSKFPELITESSSIESARKHFADAAYAISDKINNFSIELTKSLEEALNKAGKEFKERHSITIPKVDMDALEQEAKKKAYGQEDVYKKREVDIFDFLTLGISRLFRENQVKIGTKEVYDPNKHLLEVRTQYNQKFYEIVNNLSNKSKEVLELYLGSFSKKMDVVIDERNKLLEAEKKKKQSNDEIIKEIDEIEIKKKEIQPQKELCIEILENIR